MHADSVERAARGATTGQLTTESEYAVVTAHCRFDKDMTREASAAKYREPNSRANGLARSI